MGEKVTTKTFQFGGFTLVPAENLLLFSDEQVPLKPKAFETLLYLVERSGHLVERGELLNGVWGDSFIEEAAISRCVYAVRNALNEDPKNPRFIQTVPKKGYRFIAEVTVKEASEAVLHPVTANGHGVRGDVHEVEATQDGDFERQIGRGFDPFPDTRLRNGNFSETPEYIPVNANIPLAEGSHRARSFSTVAAFLFVIAGSVLAYNIYELYYDRSSGAAGGTAKRIAVLPLKPIGDIPRDSIIEFAIAESLILKMSTTPELQVRPLSAVRKYVELDRDPIDAGRELKADYVLSSNYQIVDDIIRVTSQLFDTSTGKTEAIFRSESKAGDRFAMQDSISNEIGNAVLARFGRPASIFVARRGTENEEAYSLYQQAWYLMDKHTAEESDKAAKLLDQAVGLDPNYAQAWAVRSYAHCQFAHLGGGEPMEVFATAEPMLERAMLIDPNNAIAYTIRGTINRDFHWNFPQAIDDLKHAIELDPSTVLAHRILAGVYYRNGQFAEAIESQKRAVDLHPTSLTDHWFLGTYLVAAGRKPEGISQLNRVAEMNPAFPLVYQALWEIHHVEGNYPQAYENFLKLKEVWGRPQEEIAMFEKAYKSDGWPGVLRAELNWALSMEPKGKYCKYKYYIAAIAALSGDNDLAFEYLDLAIRYRLVAVSFLKVDPKLANLRNDLRFNAVLGRVGLIPSSQI